MKRFPNGMAGVCITTLAIMGMVLSGYALSVQESERVVTGYEYITDVSGLFEYSQDPQYVTYNPAENWTGFYTTDQNVTGGIDFKGSGAANSYPIKQPSTQLSSESTDLKTLNLAQLDPPVDTSRGVMGPFWGIMWNTDAHFPTPNEDITEYPHDYSPYPYVATLPTLISAVTTEGADRIVIDLGTGDSAPVIALANWMYDKILSTVEGMGTRYWDTYTLNLDDSDRIASIDIILESGISTGYASDGSVIWTGQSAADLCVMYGFVESSIPGTGLQDQQLTSTVTITLYDDPTPIYMDTNQGITLSDSPAHWTNGYPIGGMDILFRVPTTGQEYTNTIVFPLTDGPGGADAGSITAYVSVSSGGRVQVSLDSGTEQQTIDIGQWRNFILSMDFIDGTYRVVPVTNFATFNDYSEVDNARTFTGISARGTAEIVTWGYSGQSLMLGIVQTEVFMNTYGVVMTDPSLTITDYFPELTDLRLNFYSFALYGDSISVNGKTYAVTDDAQINIPQVGDDGEPVDSYHTLTNIYITFEDHTYITFVNEDFTADLGPTTTDTISFMGNWYFTTGLYEGFETTESYSEWTPEKFVFDSNGAIIVYLGLLALGTAVIAKVAGIRALDIVIVACAGIFGYVMLGAF